MAKKTVSDKNQAEIKAALTRLFNISPCKGTATECAAVWRGVFGSASFKGQNWGVWVDPGAIVDPEPAENTGKTS